MNERAAAERRIVETLAAYTLEKLARPENRAKGGWSDKTPEWLLCRLREEVEELREAVGLVGIQGLVAVECVALEAADVAAFAAMIVDVVGARRIIGPALDALAVDRAELEKALAPMPGETLVDAARRLAAERRGMAAIAQLLDAKAARLADELDRVKVEADDLRRRAPEVPGEVLDVRLVRTRSGEWVVRMVEPPKQAPFADNLEARTQGAR